MQKLYAERLCMQASRYMQNTRAELENLAGQFGKPLQARESKCRAVSLKTAQEQIEAQRREVACRLTWHGTHASRKSVAIVQTRGDTREEESRGVVLRILLPTS